MKVALCVIATGKYKQFLSDLLATADEFFCRAHERMLFVFIDQSCLCLPEVAAAIELRHAAHEPWPGPTLHRYRTMLRAAGDLAAGDYVYYVDVDSRFVRPVGDEIFGDLAATVHYGFVEKRRCEWTLDCNPNSRACVGPRDRWRPQHYYAGGFQGGRAGVYLDAMRAMDAAIADDESCGVTAWWHDESHWNRYLIDPPPAVELSHDYMCPPQWRPETQRIVIVGKNNGEVRA